jgi:uncharacterized MAPEG superfamily protein
MNATPVSSLTLLAMLAAALMPIVCAGIAKSPGFGKRRREGGFDNHNPRLWLANLQGWQARANAAQANCFEALPFFLAAVLMAHFTGAAPDRVAALCGLWLALRVAFVGLYLADRANARTLVWVAALAVNVTLLFSGRW